jgi:hypothetical protein
MGKLEAFVVQTSQLSLQIKLTFAVVLCIVQYSNANIGGAVQQSIVAPGNSNSFGNSIV